MSESNPNNTDGEATTINSEVIKESSVTEFIAVASPSALLGFDSGI